MDCLPPVLAPPTPQSLSASMVLALNGITDEAVLMGGRALPCVRFCVIFIKLCLHHMTLPGVERSTPWPTKAVSNHQEIEAKCQGQNLNH